MTERPALTITPEGDRFRRGTIGAAIPAWQRTLLSYRALGELSAEDLERLAPYAGDVQMRRQLANLWYPKGWSQGNHMDLLHEIPAARLKMQLHDTVVGGFLPNTRPTWERNLSCYKPSHMYYMGDGRLEIEFTRSAFLKVKVTGFLANGEIAPEGLKIVGRYGNIWKEFEEDLTRDTIEDIAYVIADFLDQMDPVMGGSGGNVMANYGLASWGVWGTLPLSAGGGDAMVLHLVQATTLPSDAQLRDYTDLGNAITGGGGVAVVLCSAAGYTRKDITTTGGGGSNITTNTGLDRKELDYPTQTWSGVAAGQTIAKLFHGYDDDISSGTNANVLPISWHDLDFVLDGNDVILDINDINRAS